MDMTTVKIPVRNTFTNQILFQFYCLNQIQWLPSECLYQWNKKRQAEVNRRFIELYNNGEGKKNRKKKLEFHFK